MKIGAKYSHLNGEEYLLVHHKKEYKELLSVIKAIDASIHKTKVSKEKTMVGKMLYSPGSINKDLKTKLEALNWNESRRNFYVSDQYDVVKQIESMTFKDQKEYLNSIGHPLLDSFNQTDFIKNQIGLEVQLGKYFSVTYDLFVKHLSFYGGGLINVGIEIVPMKSMQKEMSSGPPWYEKEIHNVMRHGRTNPPVPLLIIGIEP
jgi:hypothetical protein